MTKTKREKNYIIASFTILTIFNFVFILILFLNIYPWIKEVEKLKTEWQKVFNEYNTIQKEWQSLAEFKASIKKNEDIKQTTYTQKVVDELTQEFYSTYFKNKKYNTFDEFITNLSKEYSDKNINNEDDQIKDIGVILPTYSQVISNFDENSISDFKFVNYIESLANSFNLSFEESIWINSVEKVEWFSSSSWNSSLESNIYYIPLNMSFNWRKKSIINFIYFIQNVWNVKKEVNSSWEEELSFENNIKDSSFYDMTKFSIIGQSSKRWSDSFYNIISDFWNISFSEYLDSWFEDRNESNNLIDYVKTQQWNESISVNAILKFYVKGLPLYIVEESINNFLKEHNSFLKEVTKISKSKESSLSEKEEAEIILRSLNQIDTVHITSIKQSLSNKKELDKSYNNVIRFREMYQWYADKLWIDFEFGSINNISKENTDEEENNKEQK